MKLEPDKKLEKNLKLMRSCSQVRIIQLTERLSKLIGTQKRMISKCPTLRTLLTTELNRILELNGQPKVEQPTIEDLIGIKLPNYTISQQEDLPEVHSYMSVCTKTACIQKTFADHQDLNSILSAEIVSLEKLNALMNNKKTSRSFKRFIRDMKEHSPMYLSTRFKITADGLAKRNNLVNHTYYEKSNNLFTTKDTAISLNNDFKGRLVNTGTKLIAGVALSALLISSGMSLYRDDTDVLQADVTPHISAGETIVTSQEPIITISSEETPALKQTGPISNSIEIKSYKTACDDFFQKTAEVYKYNTGKDISLTGYEQSDIGINRSARILRVEKDGVVYNISTQSPNSSNPTYLKKALDSLGVSYTEYTAKTTYIIDKYDSTKSIAIVDDQGNPVRSGNILVSTGSGGNYTYNQQMVQRGRNILEAEGRDGISLSEAECVAAYILSDSYNTQNPELSIALGQTAKLADKIKSYFYGEDDSYAVYIYSQDSAKFADGFNKNANALANSTQDMEHDER